MHSIDYYQDINKAKELFNEKKYEQSLKIIENIPSKNKEIELEKQILRAAIYVRINEPRKAIKLIAQVEENNKENLALLNIKAIAYRSIKEYLIAKEILEFAIQKYPESADLAHNLSVTAVDIGQLDLAEKMGLKAIALKTNYIEAYKNLGRIYVTRRQIDKALWIFQKLNEIEPNSEDVLVGMGAIKLLESKPAEAVPFFERALLKNDELSAAWANLGVCKKYLNNYTEAKKCLEMAIQKDPNQVEHVWNLSLINLAMGNFEEGWKQYEIRYDPRRIATDAVKLPNTKILMLTGQDKIDGKTIILVQEQGYGDTFQFFRLAKLLKREGAKKIIAVVAKELTEVIRTIPWIDEVQTELKNEKTVPDFWAFSMSLPARYKFRSVNDIPNFEPYIHVDHEKKEYWKQYLENKIGNNKFRVGLVWAGRESHSNDSNRSIALETLMPLFDLHEKVQFIALQKGEKEKEAQKFKTILSCGSALQNFSDTAALLSNIDLLISIDSSPIHLAGAMGMPVWSLIPSFFDFRWMVNSKTTPWYPTMKLFRQSEANSWKKVIQEVRLELEKMAAKKPKRWSPEILVQHPYAMTTTHAGSNLFINAAFKHHLDNNLNDAENMYKMHLKYEPNSLNGLRNLAALYRKKGLTEEAEKTYKLGEYHKINDPIFYTNYANLLMQLGRPEEAMQKIELALLSKPNHQPAIQLKEQYLLNLKK